MADEQAEDPIAMMGTWPPPELPAELDFELVQRRFDMTVAERFETHFRAKRLLDRVVKRVRDKYAISVRYE